MGSRWESAEDDDVVLGKFKNALISALRERLGDDTGEFYRRTFEQKFSTIHGSPFGAVSGTLQVVRDAKDRREVALITEHLLAAAADVPRAYDGITTYLESVATAVHDALKRHPLLQLKLVKIHDVYEVHPAGAEELDLGVVSHGLEWLARYPAIQEVARRALRSMAEGDAPASLSASRETLEMLTKAILGNEKSLENQIGSASAADAPLLRWMREKGVKPQTITMTQRVVASYCDFQNEWVKHPPAAGTTFSPAEVEHAIYTTFVLIRFLSRLA